VDLQLDGKRALVTGSTSGIGRAVATALAGEGAVVAVHGRDRKRAEETAAVIAGSGGKAVVALGDLSRDDGREAVVSSVESELGGIDILINNVGGSVRDGWSAAEPADWAARQRPADQFLVGVGAVDFRGVEESDPALNRRPDQADHLVFIAWLPITMAHAHAAKS